MPQHQKKRRRNRNDRGRRQQPNEISLLVDRADGATMVRNVNTGAERLVPPRGGFRSPRQPKKLPAIGGVPALGGSLRVPERANISNKGYTTPPYNAINDAAFDAGAINTAIGSGVSGAAEMLNRGAKSMGQVGNVTNVDFTVPGSMGAMAARAADRTVDQMNANTDFNIAETRRAVDGIYNSPANVAERERLMKQRQDAQQTLSGVQDKYQKMSDRQLYDTSDPKNMAMAVAPRENLGIDEGMVAESAQRAALRDSMNRTQGGMVSTDALGRMANRESQARLAPQRALAQREDVSSQSGRGFTRTVDRDPDSPTFGRATVVGTRPVYGPNVTESVKSYLDQGGSINAGTPEARAAKSALMTIQQPRRDARMAGEVFEDPDTGAITDYGKLNARNERRAKESQAARELRTRTAQVQGMSPGISRAGAAGVAAGQLRAEKLMQDEMAQQRDREDSQTRRDMILEAYKSNPNDPRLSDAFSQELGLRDFTSDEAFDKLISDKVEKNELAFDPRSFPRTATAMSELGAEQKSQIANGLYDFLTDDDFSLEQKRGQLSGLSEDMVANLIDGTEFDENTFDLEQSEQLMKLYKDVMGIPEPQRRFGTGQGYGKRGNQRNMNR